MQRKNEQWLVRTTDLRKSSAQDHWATPVMFYQSTRFADILFPFLLEDAVLISSKMSRTFSSRKFSKDLQRLVIHFVYLVQKKLCKEVNVFPLKSFVWMNFLFLIQWLNHTCPKQSHHSPKGKNTSSGFSDLWRVWQFTVRFHTHQLYIFL